MKQDNGEERLSKWTQQLHDKLAEHQTEAPDDLWADIEAALPEPQPRKARFVALRRWAAAAAVAAVLGGGSLVWLWQQGQTLQMEQTLQTASLESEDVHIPDSDNEQSAPVSLPDSNDERSATASLPSKERVGSGGSNSNSYIAQAETPKSKTTAIDPLTIHQDEPQKEKQDEPLTVQQEKAHRDIETTGRDDSSVDAAAYVSTKNASAGKRSSGIWAQKERHSIHTEKRQPALSLYAMNGLGTKDNSNAVIMADALAQKYTTTLANAQTSKRLAPIYLTGYEEREHHHQPLSFGLSVSYPLNQRLSLTSGIVYTKAQSEFTQIILSQQINKDQVLHYVGIPLNLNYRLWQLNGFSAYVGAGMQADWNVHARLKVEGVEQEMVRDRVQWSANASIGLQYNILPQIAIYAEPGINHFFDNGSQVQNYFKDKPTSMKLQMGIRIKVE